MRYGSRPLLALAAVLLSVLPGPQAQAQVVSSVHVRANRLVLPDGSGLRLLGVNRSGAEYACVQGWGIFDGPTDAVSVAAIRRWRVNTVRLPLNEDCWLGLHGVKPTLSGLAYQNAIRGYVNRLHAAGMAVVLELHWNGNGLTRATGQQLMADATWSPQFWRSVALAFRADPAVLFDLYNEPHGISWSCWRDGCLTTTAFRVAGMQSLVNAVRGAGAKQPLVVNGLDWGADVSRWAQFAPKDPLGQLVAGLHLYNTSGCRVQSCWDATVAPLTGRVPVLAGEIGEKDCLGTFVTSFMRWADAHRVSYLGWTWNTWDCKSGPALITRYDGTPTPYGLTLRTHLLALTG
jgi:endoglucanase